MESWWLSVNLSACVCERETGCAYAGVCIRVHVRAISGRRGELAQYAAAQEWTNRAVIGHEPLICSTMYFTKTELVQ